ncbi:MAG: lecithin retinol acyltransferase family protein [Candidatus Thiodiazotropha sp. (ex Dulcina madagascariensis)]|nr:lecithin retinol acyltransferase family protein [Candidatus Thiodiazotropha sp. (ex Epidulcina cf. delphinae)]MCU7921612.1 lecithin retinol acyltransferase family protein [Candidatus Thiodiazotropha sp. (ex Dulcina madagascariensis)]MCU7928572.1 lecithin retinol acyltransferase family protein [Candidatus Thiodiazotropha sp. (ex Dulcina madagascariensis)]
MLAVGSELSVPRQFYLHKGAYLGNGWVLHNHPERGEEVVTMDQFAGGREITVSKHGVENVADFLFRVRETLSNSGSYDFFRSNCEHTVNKLRTGVAKSPQILVWGCIGLIAAYSLLRSR